jgi:hypothetical protein
MAAAAQTTEQLGSVCGLGDEARLLLRPGLPPREFVSLLMEHGHFADAARFVAHALPKREAVWWAWVCARRMPGPPPSPAAKASLDAAEKWIAQPTEENRRAAMAAAEAAGFDTAAGCASLAAFLSGPSLAPPEAPAVPPGPYESAKVVAGAITLAAVKEPEKAAENFRAFLQQGLDVTARIKLW